MTHESSHVIIDDFKHFFALTVSYGTGKAYPVWAVAVALAGVGFVLGALLF